MRVSHVPLRASTGAFILNAGLAKKSLAPDGTEATQGMPGDAFPQLGSMSPDTFGKALIGGEIALGAVLLTPVVPPVVAGAALTAFSAGLLKMWWSTPGMREVGSLRPTQQGAVIAKDVWMLGTGLALVIDGLSDGARRTAKRTSKAARRTAKRTSKAASRTTKAAREVLPISH